METHFQPENVSEKTKTSLSDERKRKEKLDISHIIGEDGRWQRKIFLLTLMCSITAAWNHLGISFLAYPVEYWCSKPQSMNISLDTWQAQYLPNITSAGEVHHSQCEMFVKNFTSHGGLYDLNETRRCNSWEFSSDYHSIVEEWNVVCEKSWILSMSQSIYMLGFLVAVSLSGQMSDLLGRRPTTILNAFILSISSFATAFSPSFTVFVILRCFVALGQSGMDLAAYVLMTEVYGTSSRATYLMLQSFAFCFGFILLPIISWLLSDWFYLQLVFAITSLYYIHFIWNLPESPRWLLSKGHFEKAIVLLEAVVKENGIVVHNIEEEIHRIYHVEKQKKEKEKNVTFIHLFKSPNLRKKTLYLFFIWITLAFTYYGLSFYSTELYGNKFLNFFFIALMELPTSIYCLLTANRFGRKKILFLSLIIGGASCLGFIVIPKGYEVVQNILAFSGKLFISAAFTIVYLFSAEIFPTVARNAGIGICSMVARIGSALSPFMKDLSQATYKSVPLVLFGVLCMISSLLLLKLPETSFQPIPETITEAEIELTNVASEKKI